MERQTMKAVRPMAWCPILLAAAATATGWLGFVFLCVSGYNDDFFGLWYGLCLVAFWPAVLLNNAGAGLGIYGAHGVTVAGWALVGLGLGAFIEFRRRRAATE